MFYLHVGEYIFKYFVIINIVFFTDLQLKEQQKKKLNSGGGGRTDKSWHFTDDLACLQAAAVAVTSSGNHSSISSPAQSAPSPKHHRVHVSHLDPSLTSSLPPPGPSLPVNSVTELPVPLSTPSSPLPSSPHVSYNNGSPSASQRSKSVRKN